MANDPTQPQRGVRFDATINLGHILTGGSMILVLVVGWVNFDNRLNSVEKQISTATSTLLDVTRLSERLAAMDSRMGRIERLLEQRP